MIILNRSSYKVLTLLKGIQWRCSLCYRDFFFPQERYDLQSNYNPGLRLLLPDALSRACDKSLVVYTWRPDCIKKQQKTKIFLVCDIRQPVTARNILSIRPCRKWKGFQHNMDGTAISLTDCCYKGEFSIESGDLLKEPEWLLLQCQRKIYGKHDQMHSLLNGLWVKVSVAYCWVYDWLGKENNGNPLKASPWTSVD